MNAYTRQDLSVMQAWPLDRKIRVTQAKIIEWYHHYGGKVAVSFSGGKDSTVLLDLARRAGLAGELRGLAHIAISSDAAEPLIAAGLEVAIAAQPNEDSMFEQLARIEAARNRAGDA